MPCGTEDDYEEMYEENTLAERGFSQEEIDYLTAKVEAARATANVKAADEGRTVDEQEEAMRQAQRAAIADWHIEMHAKLEGDMKLIKMLRHQHART